MEVETEMLDSAKENGSSTNQEVKKNSDTSSMERREKTYVWLCGVLTLTPIILIIVMLLSLPTVFYALHKKPQSNVSKLLLCT